LSSKNKPTEHALSPAEIAEWRRDSRASLAA
jgi:hypothetical protein